MGHREIASEVSSTKALKSLNHRSRCPILTTRIFFPLPVLFWGGGGWVVYGKNHLEERLLDQAQARASYTPFFWGRSRSIPQCMVSDV